MFIFGKVGLCFLLFGYFILIDAEKWALIFGEDSISTLYIFLFRNQPRFISPAVFLFNFAREKLHLVTQSCNSLLNVLSSLQNLKNVV